jgi:hypothetical protein
VEAARQPARSAGALSPLRVEASVCAPAVCSAMHARLRRGVLTVASDSSGCQRLGLLSGPLLHEHGHCVYCRWCLATGGGPEPALRARRRARAARRARPAAVPAGRLPARAA